MSLVTQQTAPGWAKIKFYYKFASTMALTSTSELALHQVTNMTNRLEVNYWESAITATQYVYDTGSAGVSTSADYLVLYNHNFYSGSADITLQYSSDNFVADVNDAFTAECPTSDEIFLKEFDPISSTYWRLKIENASVAPKITVGYWGDSVELDWCSVSFDPNQQKNNAVVNRSTTGYVLGVYEKFVERVQDFTWTDADLGLYTKLLAWFEAIGRENFFVAWDTTDHSTEIYMMYSDGQFNCPYTFNGRYRTCSVSLTGRKVE